MSTRRHRRLRAVQPRLGRAGRSRSAAAARRRHRRAARPRAAPTASSCPASARSPTRCATCASRGLDDALAEQVRRPRASRSSASASACSCWPRRAPRAATHHGPRLDRRRGRAASCPTDDDRAHPPRRLERGRTRRGARRSSTASRRGADFYFVHSYHLRCRRPGDVAATTPYCGGFVVGRRSADTVFGVQFHPEKSQQHGLRSCCATSWRC